MDELKLLAAELTLVDTGKKGQLIARILHFIDTGQKLTLPKFPTVSCAKRGVVYPLKPSALMLKGAYKNDLKTRLFFKKLIGEHFHFTAFGIDWLNERWMKGDPPCYQAFADMWIQETKRRAQTPASPKEEWAYIRFVQHFMEHAPGSSRDVVLQAWENERVQHKKTVMKLLA